MWLYLSILFPVGYNENYPICTSPTSIWNIKHTILQNLLNVFFKRTIILFTTVHHIHLCPLSLETLRPEQEVEISEWPGDVHWLTAFVWKVWPKEGKKQQTADQTSGVLAFREQKEKDVSMKKMRPKALVEIEGGGCFRWKGMATEANSWLERIIPEKEKYVMTSLTCRTEKEVM